MVMSVEDGGCAVGIVVNATFQTVQFPIPGDKYEESYGQHEKYIAITVVDTGFSPTRDFQGIITLHPGIARKLSLIRWKTVFLCFSTNPR